MPVDLRRRLFFTAGVWVTNALALPVFLAVAGVAPSPLRAAAGAVAALYASLVLYHAAFAVDRRLRGIPFPAWRELPAFLFPEGLAGGASVAAGVALGLAGRLGWAPMLLGTAAFVGAQLLHWQYRRMALAREQVEVLYRYAAEAPACGSVADVEAAVGRATGALLGEAARLCDRPPGPGELGATLRVAGQEHWLVVVPAEGQAIVEGADERLLDAVAAIAAQVLENLALREELRDRAARDPLTGLANRGALDRALAGALAAAGGGGDGFALLFGDLDGFKPVNDALGHAAGDLVLREVADRLRARARRSDLVARAGGDEFCVVLADIASAEEAAVVAADLAAAVAEPIAVAGTAVQVTISFGVAVWPADGRSADDLLRSADARMYDRKRGCAPTAGAVPG